jgi:hypothetical protein
MLTVEFGADAGYPIVRPHRSGGRRELGHGGGETERSLSPAPTIEEVVPESAQQATGAGEPRASTEEEAPAEAGLVDIASILGTPTVTVVRSSL